MGASPKKKGPPGHISKANYKLLCAALSSFIPMNQMNARAGDNTRTKLIATTMISGSSAAGEPLPPHFQFQTSAQTAEAEYIRIKCIRYMLDVRARFGHDEEQSFSISLGLNSKGGWTSLSFTNIS